MTVFLWFLIGLFLLVLWAKRFITSSETIARYFGVSELIIWMLIIWCGTSLPELFISTTAAIQWHGSVALANVVGSNIANIALIGGVLLLFLGALPQHSFAHKDIIYFLLSNSILIGMVVLSYMYGSFTIPLLLSAVLIIFLCYYLWQEMSWHQHHQQQDKITISRSTWILWIVWFLLLIGWSQMTVYFLEPLALSRWISEYIIWIFLVAVGTSLPELVTSVIAYLQWSRDIAFGNILGSNIFNMFGVLGISSLFGTITIQQSYRKDGLMMIVCSMIFVAILSQKKLPPRMVVASWFWLVLLYGWYIWWIIK